MHQQQAPPLGLSFQLAVVLTQGRPMPLALSQTASGTFRYCLCCCCAVLPDKVWKVLASVGVCHVHVTMLQLFIQGIIACD